MEKRTTTVQMDKHGRIVIPKHVRETLACEEGESATVEVDVGVVENDA